MGQPVASWTNRFAVLAFGRRPTAGGLGVLGLTTYGACANPGLSRLLRRPIKSSSTPSKREVLGQTRNELARAVCGVSEGELQEIFYFSRSQAPAWDLTDR